VEVGQAAVAPGEPDEQALLARDERLDQADRVHPVAADLLQRAPPRVHDPHLLPVVAAVLVPLDVGDDGIAPPLEPVRESARHIGRRRRAGGHRGLLLCRLRIQGRRSTQEAKVRDQTQGGHGPPGTAGSRGEKSEKSVQGPGAHDDVVMALALAVYAAPESAPVPLGSQVLLGSSAGGMRRG